MQLRNATEASLEINEELEGADESYLTVFQVNSPYFKLNSPYSRIDLLLIQIPPRDQTVTVCDPVTSLKNIRGSRDAKQSIG